jgi:hypothetical protein
MDDSNLEMGNTRGIGYMNYINACEFAAFNDFSDLIDYYNNEKKHLLFQLECLEIDQGKIVKYIRFLEKKYYLIDVTHNNTINFVLSKNNSQSIRRILHFYNKIYRKINDDIKLISSKIRNINLFISKFT